MRVGSILRHIPYALDIDLLRMISICRLLEMKSRSLSDAYSSLSSNGYPAPTINRAVHVRRKIGMYVDAHTSYRYQYCSYRTELNSSLHGNWTVAPYCRATVLKATVHSPYTLVIIIGRSEQLAFNSAAQHINCDSHSHSQLLT